MNCCRPGQYRCPSTGLCISTMSQCDGWDNLPGNGPRSQPGVGVVGAAEPAIDAGPSSSYVIALLVSVFAIISGVLMFFYCRHRFIGGEELPDILHDSAGDPLSPKGCSRMAKPMLSHKNSGRCKELLKPNASVRMSTLNTSSISSSYERSHITGFSYCKFDSFIFENFILQI